MQLEHGTYDSKAPFNYTVNSTVICQCIELVEFSILS